MANAIYTIYLAIRIADAEKCAQNLATFGVGTNIKSILLTFPLVWGGSLRCKLPLYTNRKVNRIDLIFVPTPKVAKFCAHFSAPSNAAAK
jgi:hypothetical protein